MLGRGDVREKHVKVGWEWFWKGLEGHLREFLCRGGICDIK